MLPTVSVGLLITCQLFNSEACFDMLHFDYIRSANLERFLITMTKQNSQTGLYSAKLRVSTLTKAPRCKDRGLV